MTTRKLMIAAMVAACAAAAPMAMAESANPSPKRSAGEFAGDAMITTKVKAALLKEQATQSLSIKVTTVNGVVQLAGTADDEAQIDSAVRVARGIDGVQDVKNDIQLKQQPQR
ncbi:MAG: BON domain-containing protein [Pigmentiphaga sp.]|uniref:BON domain-containing protein n=1 Tax=Pigmentiphaga sp. TaxID=1977564 RepID=UPI0029BE3DBA|nr:BON domain-containing protein [Pigmentiphaga sp.]MDX3907519.1 BON domain-containing protein [Pigmentiphaga sp.]